jgi:hypothetical protein
VHYQNSRTTLIHSLNHTDSFTSPAFSGTTAPLGVVPQLSLGLGPPPGPPAIGGTVALSRSVNNTATESINEPPITDTQGHIDILSLVLGLTWGDATTNCEGQRFDQLDGATGNTVRRKRSRA